MGQSFTVVVYFRVIQDERETKLMVIEVIRRNELRDYPSLFIGLYSKRDF